MLVARLPVHFDTTAQRHNWVIQQRFFNLKTADGRLNLVVPPHTSWQIARMGSLPSRNAFNPSLSFAVVVVAVGCVGVVVWCGSVV